MARGWPLVLLWSSLRQTAWAVQGEADPFEMLTQEDWQPGRVGEFNTTVPQKDLECLGPYTAITFNPELDWETVKDKLHANLADPMSDRWLLAMASKIQQVEPDHCVLGITCTSAWLLPMTMPKIRNRARMLNTDHNLMILNVSFVDTMRSGFPVFGVLDGLATDEYCEWFGSEEARQYFEPREEAASCQSPAAEALLRAVGKLRSDSGLRSAPLRLAMALFGSGEAEGDAACLPAVATALLVYALARLEAGLSAGGNGGGMLARRAVLRDVHELVSRAEEHVRAYTWDEGVAFGELVATPWRLWFVLHRLQLLFLQFLGPQDPHVWLPDPPPGGWSEHPQKREEL